MIGAPATEFTPVERARWLELAEQATPMLFRRAVSPVGLVDLAPDPNAWQGWAAHQAGTLGDLLAREWKAGDSALVDFGAHLAGYLSLEVRPAAGRCLDAPVRLKLEFGETAAELGRPFDPYTGTLCRAWLQDEVVTLDDPGLYRLPRRYAFRYLRITVLATRRPFRLAGVSAESVTAADWSCRLDPPLGPQAPKALRAIWSVGLLTLANCMQTVFEDGPKRDRRLWLGDLRIQALANYYSFRHMGLVRRCLFLFGGLADQDGLVPGCLYERPEPSSEGSRMLTYAALFGPVLRDYLEASGDRECALALWPVALRQVEIIAECRGVDGLVTQRSGFWNFVDWCKLDKQAPVHAIALYGVRQTAELAGLLNLDAAATTLTSLGDALAEVGRKHLFDAASGVVISGPSREVSVASAAWAILSRMVAPEEGRRVLENALTRPDAIQPATPYMWHYVVEAMACCGMREPMARLLQDYWGGMIARGAQTFWEVYEPRDPLFSPYGSYHANSCCHAWSCGPVYVIGRWLAGT